MLSDLGALARTAAVTKGFDPEISNKYLESAVKAAEFIKKELYDEKEKILYRVYRKGRGDTKGFADDYAFLIEGLIDLYEATFETNWLQWADELQRKPPPETLSLTPFPFLQEINLI